MKWPFGLCIFTLLLSIPWTAQGQNSPPPSSGEVTKPTTIKIVLHPMGEPRPALKYRFLPPYIDLKPGNAAIQYLKIAAGREPVPDIEKIAELLDLPLADLRTQQVRDLLNRNKTTIDDLLRASLCERCDWEDLLREQGIETRFGNLSLMRNYSKLLALKARWEIAEGKFDEAVRTLQAGYALAQHTAKGPTLIQCLVGNAIVDIMNLQVQEFLQQTDAPNLYWALSTLPRPVLDYRSAIEGECGVIYLILPQLREWEKKEITPEQWNRFFQETLDKINALGGAKRAKTDLGLTAVIAMEYPRMKRYLIDCGIPAEKVEAMPVAQVAMVATLRHYEEWRDQTFKWMYVASEGEPPSRNQLEKFRQEMWPLELILLPAIHQLPYRVLKTERDIAILRILEGLRMYGASHGGQFPEKLADIREVPLPNDPLRKTPFTYRREGNTAILESISPPDNPNRESSVRFEIQFAQKGN